MIMRCQRNDNYFAESQNFEISADQINANTCFFKKKATLLQAMPAEIGEKSSKS